MKLAESFLDVILPYVLIFIAIGGAVAIVICYALKDPTNKTEELVDYLIDNEVILACDMRNDGTSVECYFDRWR